MTRRPPRSTRFPPDGRATPAPRARGRIRSTGHLCHWDVDAALARYVPCALIPGIGMSHHTGAGVVGENALELARGPARPVRDHHHSGMARATAAHAAAL